LLPIYKPYLNENNLKYAHEALDSTWVSSNGPYIQQVEHDLAAYYNINYFIRPKVLLTSNGTTALHLCARLLKNNYPKIKKILAPNNVYVAAWNAFLFDRNYIIETIDADINTWNIDLEKLYLQLNKEDFSETALLVVHNVGNILNVPKIKRDFPDLIIIEDNCEGFCGTYEGLPSGSVSFTSSISFFGNKNLTSGEGGAIIASESDLDYLLCLRSQGQSNIRFIHEELGYNYRITNPSAAILKGQIESWPKITKLKQDVFDLYRKLLKGVDGIELQQTDQDTTHSNWMFGVRIIGNKNYNNIDKYFKNNYIEVRPMFYPVNAHKHLKDIKFDSIDVAKKLNQEIVIIPCWPGISEHEVCHVVNTLKNYIRSK